MNVKVKVKDKANRLLTRLLRFMFRILWNMWQLKDCRFHPLNPRMCDWLGPIIKTRTQAISNTAETLGFMNCNAPGGGVYRCVEITSERAGVYTSDVSFIFCWRFPGVYYPITLRWLSCGCLMPTAVHGACEGGGRGGAEEEESVLLIP